ncbi:MAG TPA: hypothetical protein PKZ41_02650 [Candidatus Omnitrophota bacterium]|nr:hypothetical protein [Candidatus Omnitrophota bacterium]
MNIRKASCFIVILALAFMIQGPIALAADPFELTIQLFYEHGEDKNIYYESINPVIEIGGGPVRPFKVVLKNTSSSPQPLNIDLAQKGLGLLTFEITDESGNKNVVSKKPDPILSKSESYIYVAPGKTKEFEIILTEREWNNAFKLIKQGSSKVRARASYKNGSKMIYSDYYTLVLKT